MNKLFVLFSVLALVVLLPQARGADYAYLVEITGTSFLPGTIYAGDIASLKVDIKNRGLSVSVVDLNAFLDLGVHFEDVQSKVSVREILPGQTKTLIFRFKVKDDTLPGYYPAFLTIYYYNLGSLVEQTNSFSVPVAKIEKNIDVTAEPKKINPGNQTELVFSLKNVGQARVSNVSFSWTEPNNLILPVGSDNKKYVSAIEAGETVKISYTVAADPNITTGIYPLNLTMTFLDVNGVRTQNSQVGLIVGGGTDFEVSAELVSGQLSLSIANIGSNNAQAVIARIPRQNGITVSGSNISILGNLNKGDFTVASFTVQTRTQANASGSEQAPVSTNEPPFAQNAQTQRGAFPRTASATDTNFFRQRQFDSNSLQVQPIFVEIDYTDTTGERQTSRKTVLLGQTGSFLLSDSVIASRSRASSQADISPWMALSAILGFALIACTFKADRKNLKKMIAVIAVCSILFIAAAYYFNSSQVFFLSAIVVSIVLFVLYFFKFRAK
ncbi:MAG: NEW3 domain-containing protein [Candidatus Diapherotrites archaeon]